MGRLAQHTILLLDSNNLSGPLNVPDFGRYMFFPILLKEQLSILKADMIHPLRIS
jgi:hypothetical protein